MKPLNKILNQILSQRYSQIKLNEQIAPAVERATARSVVRSGVKAAEKGAVDTFKQSAKTLEAAAVKSATSLGKLTGTSEWKAFEQALDDKIAAEIDSLYSSTGQNINSREAANKVATKIVLDSNLTGRKSDEIVDFIVQRVNNQVGYTPKIKEPPGNINVVQPRPSEVEVPQTFPYGLTPRPMEIDLESPQEVPQPQPAKVQPPATKASTQLQDQQKGKEETITGGQKQPNKKEEPSQRFSLSNLPQFSLAALALPAAAILSQTSIQNIPLKPKAEAGSGEEDASNAITNRRPRAAEDEDEFDFNKREPAMKKELFLGKYGGTYVRK